MTQGRGTGRAAMGFIAAVVLLVQAFAGSAGGLTQTGPPPTEPPLDPPPGAANALVGLTHAKLKTVQSDRPVAVICPHKQDNSPIGVMIIERGANLPVMTTGQARVRGHGPVEAHVHQIFATKFTDVVLRNVIYDEYYNWNPPLYGDLDGDGHLTCDKQGNVDYDDFARACGVSDPVPAKFGKSTPSIALKVGATQTLAGGTYSLGSIKLAKSATLQSAPGSTGTIFTNQVTAAEGSRLLFPGWKVVAVAGPIALDNATTASGLFLSVPEDFSAGTDSVLTGRFCGYRIIFSDNVTVH